MFRSCGDAASAHASRSAAGIAPLRFELGERRPGPDHVAVDAARHDAADVDEPLGLEEAVAQERHHLGAAG